MLHRRLARDYETLPTRSEAVIHIAMTDLMARLSPARTPSPGATRHPRPKTKFRDETTGENDLSDNSAVRRTIASLASVATTCMPRPARPTARPGQLTVFGAANCGLPKVSAAPPEGTPALHVYAMGLGKAAASLASAFNNIAVTQDTATDLGNLDGGGASFSAKALEEAGVKPGATVARAGLHFTWPSTAGATKAGSLGTYGEPDNALASGQTFAVDGTRGSTLGFLVSASYGPTGGIGTVYYSDGTKELFSLNSPDWFGGDGDKAISTTYQNRQGNETYQGSAYVYYVGGAAAVRQDTGQRQAARRQRHSTERHARAARIRHDTRLTKPVGSIRCRGRPRCDPRPASTSPASQAGVQERMRAGICYSSPGA
jgi:hypothetical protein